MHTYPGLSGNGCHPVLFLGPKQQDMEERWMSSKGGVAAGGGGGTLSETLAAPLPLPSLGIGQKQQHSEGKQIFQGTERRLACGSRAGVSLEWQVHAVFFQFPSQRSGRPV